MVTDWPGALDRLYGLANWETRPPGTQPTFELERIRRVLAELDDPHLAWPAVHVGGTNGKGSVSAMLSSALQVAGYRVGMYTSPHLHTVRERIQVDGRLISEAEVLAWLNAHEPLIDRHHGLTTFEALTAMAFSAFAAAAVEVAVVEVGLGGRLDTTNVVHPAISVLTSIGVDHTEVLGDTVAAIAADKAGIVRSGVPVVSAPQEPEALEAIGDATRSLGSPFTLVGRDARWSPGRLVDLRQRFTCEVDGAAGRMSLDLDLGLLGRHQQVNATTAVATLWRLAERGWRIDRHGIAAGLTRTVWPGRFEVLGRRPWLVVDGAHNPAGAAALRQTLADVFPGARLHLILGLSRGKDAAGIVAPLVPGAAHVIATRSSHPRALPADEVARAAQPRAAARVEVVADPREALDVAMALAEPGDVILGSGSIFVAAAVRESWAARGGMPMPPRDPHPPSLP